MPRIARSLETPAVQVLMEKGRALGLNSAAVTILEALSRSEWLQSDLEEATGLTRATLSKHLNALEDAGFVSASTPKEARRGRAQTMWSLERQAVAEWLDGTRHLLIAANARDRGHGAQHRETEHHNAR